MKKFYKTLMFFAALIICCGTLNSFAGEPEDILKKEPSPNVYWFSINVKIDNARQEIEILDSDTKVTMGSLKSFSKAIRLGLTNHQVVIGPFKSEDEANYARIFYKKSKNEIGELPQINVSEIHWYECSLREIRKGVYKFVHIPAAVSTGSADKFIKDLFDVVKFQRIVIGPFWDYTQAEEAKAIRRQCEVRVKEY